MVHTCGLSYLGGWGRLIAWAGTWRLHWAEILTLDSSLGDRVKVCLKKNKFLAGHGDSHLLSQHFGRWRRVDHKVRSSRPARPIWWNPISTKNTKKISHVWWRTPVVPAIREVEAEESLEPGKWKFQWAKITPLHSSLGGRARLHLKKKKKLMF